MGIAKHPLCAKSCQAAEKLDWPHCEQICQITRQERAAAAEGAAVVDEQPNPKRGRLDPVTLLEVLEMAWAKAASVPRTKDQIETAVRRHDAFEGAIIVLLHADPTCDSLDAWSRMGYHAGAIHAWSSTDEIRYPPRGAPSPQHAALHVAGWTVAAALVWKMRQGVGA